MKALKILAVIVTLAANLAACAPEIEIPALEDMAMIGIIGLDYIDQENIKVTVSAPVPSDHGKEQTQIYSTVSTVTSEAMLALSTKVERMLSLSQLRVILFSEEYARKVGVSKVILDLYRNPAVGENVFVAVVKGTAAEIINGKYKNKPEVNTYLNDLLRPRVETAFSSFTSIKDFVFMMTNEVSDANVPYLIKENENVQVAQVAVFQGDKMVKLISQREGKLIQALLGRKRLPRLSFEFQEKRNKGMKTNQIVLDFVWAKSRVRSNGSLKKPIIDINLELRGVLVGYTGTKDLEKSEEISALKTKLENEIKKESLHTLQRFQKAGIDPASLEESIRQKYYGDWSRIIGMELYQKAGFDIEVKLEIVGFGTIK